MYSQKNNHPLENIFQEFLDQELAISDKKEFEDHIKNCSECKAKLNSLERLYLQIEGISEKSLSRDFSSEIIGKIESQSNIISPFPRWVVFTQILVTVIVIVTIFSFLTINYDFSIFSRIQFTWASNVQPFFNSISNGLNNLYHSLLEFDLTFSNSSFFSSSNFLSSGYILLLTISASLVWIVGNKLLLSNFNQNNINGG